MLVLAKAAMAMMLGFILSIVAGLILIPLFKKIKAGQNVSTTIGERHMKKNGTPTLGGLIFIIPVLTQCINIKVNYVSYSKETIDKTIVYCLAGIVLSIMMILISNKLIPNL